MHALHVSDRWFLKIDGGADSALQITLDTHDVRMISEALEEVLKQEGSTAS